MLVDRRWFAAELERYGPWGAAYWVATALGEAIRLALPAGNGASGGNESSGGLPPAAATLQANYLAGVLLGASSGLPALPPNRRLAPAQTACPAAAAGRSGSRAQRAYAPAHRPGRHRRHQLRRGDGAAERRTGAGSGPAQGARGRPQVQGDQQFRHSHQRPVPQAPALPAAHRRGVCRAPPRRDTLSR